jgi:hypothetical protein
MVDEKMKQTWKSSDRRREGDGREEAGERAGNSYYETQQATRRKA